MQNCHFLGTIFGRLYQIYIKWRHLFISDLIYWLQHFNWLEHRWHLKSVNWIHFFSLLLLLLTTLFLPPAMLLVPLPPTLLPPALLLPPFSPTLMLLPLLPTFSLNIPCIRFYQPDTDYIKRHALIDHSNLFCSNSSLQHKCYTWGSEIWDLHAKLGLFWDQIWDFIIVPEWGQKYT